MIYLLFEITPFSLKKRLILSTTFNEKVFSLKKDLENKVANIKSILIQLNNLERDFIKDNPEPIHLGILSSSEYILHTKEYNKWINLKNKSIKAKQNDLLNQLDGVDRTLYIYEIEERKLLI